MICGKFCRAAYLWRGFFVDKYSTFQWNWKGSTW